MTAATLQQQQRRRNLESTPSNCWQWWTPEQIAAATGCPVENVRRHWPDIFAALVERGIADRPVCAAVIGTEAIESASQFWPVREGFYLGEPEPAESYRTTLRYYPWYGRGDSQITWESGYRAAGEAIGVDLISNPDLALDPIISAHILAWFWSEHGVEAADGSRWWSLPDLARAGDLEWVRRVYQGGTDGLDRLTAIARALGG